MRATIVGAGVSGLTTAVALLEAGWDAHVVARETHESTVSVVAAAVWTPTMLEPHELTRKWAIASRGRFAEVAQDSGSGVAPLRQRELERTEPAPTGWEATPHVRRLENHELPPGYAAGLEIDGFIIEPPIYLRWLADRLLAGGGTITRAEIGRLDDVEGDVIVNCSGLGAAQLAGDASLYPIRGQVVAVTNPGIRDGIADESDVDRVAYAYPRSQEIILGGTRQPGRTDLEPDPATTERILADCAGLDERIAGLEVLEVRVGLRPGRSAVRVEPARLEDGRPVVHNYGHSGGGFILSWGCAQEVVGLLPPEG
jgi:D-amino-acid oxidase